ncbi:hypothetical protein [Phaeocystidibacter luteus]|uniref:DUF4199 domain-containing protein n=1 Tax=Phaeocystidibacter luteus TaxID=911197 RepID=A0A6N6RLT6_9FLAO|nr:hypothetical protein [Phaeocystidibacter luteus]KAB2814527.1 hypothetical protein F8C67_01960 [Phaeocystidibacter luteus]
MNIRDLVSYALKTAAGLIGFFMLMKLAGLEQHHELRLFNFVIVLIGTFSLHRKMFLKDGNHGYFSGFFSGIRMSAMAIVFFMVFLSLYASIIDPQFIELAEDSGIWGGKLSLFQTGIAILFEGLASCIVLSYTSMQYFKPYVMDTADWGQESA